MADIVQMPMASQTMEEGKIVKWLKKEGDAVQKGEEIVEIETDKTVMAIESFFSGTLRKIVAGDGDSVPVLKPIAVIGGKDEKIDFNALLGEREGKTKEESVKAEPSRQSAEPVSAPVQTAPSIPPAPQPAPAQPVDDRRVKASPAAKRVARELGVNITMLRGSGPGGRIVRADVYAAGSAPGTPRPVQAAAPQTVPASAPGTVRSTPMSRMRQAIANTVIHSKQTAPEFTVTMEVDMSVAAGRQKEFTARAMEAVGMKVTVNDIVVKAAALTLREFPLVNSRLEGQNIITPNYINIGVVVGLDEGMVIPVIEQADIRSVIDIARESRRVIALAKEGKGTPKTPATFTISNLGMFGVEEFTAIIHSPESAILAVGAVKDKVTVVDGGIHVRPMMKMTISADHRIIDGVLAAKFMARMKEMLEKGLFD